jgi:hypothetical protein
MPSPSVETINLPQDIPRGVWPRHGWPGESRARIRAGFRAFYATGEWKGEPRCTMRIHPPASRHLAAMAEPGATAPSRMPIWAPRRQLRPGGYAVHRRRPAHPARWPLRHAQPARRAPARCGGLRLSGRRKGKRRREPPANAARGMNARTVRRMCSTVNAIVSVLPLSLRPLSSVSLRVPLWFKSRQPVAGC